MQGKIFDIKRFALNDGPGIRTTIFFKGCPLRCLWCHNPESISSEIQSVTLERELDGKSFFYQQNIGSTISVEELLKEIIKDKQFFEQSGGGVTFSGGEPMCQSEFLYQVILACKKNETHVAIDTAGLCVKEDMERIAKVADLFLFDIKIVNDEWHKKYTGVSNQTILSNFEVLLKSTADVIVRIPIIPGINNTKASVTDLKGYLKDKAIQIKEINLLPFHNTGKSKYDRFGIPYGMSDLKSQAPEELKNMKHELDSLDTQILIKGL